MNSFSSIDNNQKRRTILLLTALTGMGAFTDSFNQYVVTGATFSLINEFHTTSAVSITLAVFFIGSFVGALTWGNLADRFGRKLIFLIDLAIMAVFAVLSGFATNLAMLWTFRFLMGVAAGGDYPAALSLLMEFSPKTKRGKLNGIFWLFFMFAGMAALLLGYYLFTIYGNGANQWRILLMLGAIPAIIGILLRIGSPESARWLTEREKYAEAANVTNKFTGSALTADDVRTMAAQVPKPVKSKWPKAPKTMLSAAYLPITIGLIFSQYIINFTPGTVGTEAPLVLKAFSFTGAQSLVGTAFFVYGAWSIGVIISLFVSDRIGRMNLFLIGGTGLGILDLLFLFTKSNITLLALNLIALDIVTMLWFTTSMNWATELYPTSMRASGSGYGIFLNRSSSATAVFIGPYLLSLLSPAGVFKLYGALALVSVVVTFFLLRKHEVSNKSLEEITSKFGT